MVLNSLTGPGFIESSLSCLAPGGRFVEMGRRDIWTRERIASERPDSAYHVLEVDALKHHDPAAIGASLRRVIPRVTAGELAPPHLKPLACDGDHSCHGVHAVGQAHRQERHRQERHRHAAYDRGSPAVRPHLPRNGRARRHRHGDRPLAGRAGGGGHRPERPAAPGPRSPGGH